MHKKASKGRYMKNKIKRELSFLYATHRQDLFYIAVNYHQNIPNGIQVIERTLNCLPMDASLFALSPEPFGRGSSSLYPPNLSVGEAHRYIPRTFQSGDKNRPEQKVQTLSH